MPQFVDTLASFRIRILIEQTGQFCVLLLQLREIGAVFFDVGHQDFMCGKRAFDRQDKAESGNDGHPGREHHYTLTRLQDIKSASELLPSLLHCVPALGLADASDLVVSLNST